MIQCILFDNDGTLVDSEHLGFRAMARMFSALGVQLDENELVRQYRGFRLDNTLELLATQHTVSLPDDFVANFRLAVADLFTTDLQPVHGVVETLKVLPQKKAVVSSGPLAKIRHALSVTGLAHYFGDHVYSSYEVGIWKPDPGIYAYAARDMGYRIDECVAVEDSPVGLEAAADSGMRTFFLNHFNEDCSRDDVTVINSISELPALI
jgi:HAD superfamily hydrolase (TIGR01509 family)